MAERPIFVPSTEDDSLVKEIFVDIRWHSGFAAVQKEKNIRELHECAQAIGLNSLLEVSSKSEIKTGRHLSAFHLKVKTKKFGNVPLECAFQAAKVFESGGPFVDLLQKEPREAKRDPRLQNSGRLKAFELEGNTFALEPKTFFYDWLYLNAIYEHREWLGRLNSYAGFTDIEFNPYRSINCQARSIALFITLMKRKILDDAMESPHNFRQILLKFHYDPAIRSHSPTGHNQARLADLWVSGAPSELREDRKIEPSSSYAFELKPYAPKTVEAKREHAKQLRRVRPADDDASRSYWVELLEQASLENPAANDTWRTIMNGLDLPLDEFDKVLATIREGRWRTARNPRAYLKTVARRLAQKAKATAFSMDRALIPLGDEPKHRDNFSFETAMDSIHTQTSAVPTKRPDGIWRRGEGNYDDEEEYNEDGMPLSDISFRERMLGRLPINLKELVAPTEQQRAEIDRINELLTDSHIDLAPRIKVRWENWAKAAGLDDWEYRVLVFKLNQISRDQALAQQLTDEDRRALQAAWRRFDRTGLSKLQQSAKKSSSKNVPK